MSRKQMTEEQMNAALGMSAEELDAYAEQFESGTWDASRLGKVTMGRPSLADEEVRPVTIRLPVSRIAAVDRLAASNGRTRSAEIRSVLDAWVAAS